MKNSGEPSSRQRTKSTPQESRARVVLVASFPGSINPRLSNLDHSRPAIYLLFGRELVVFTQKSAESLLTQSLEGLGAKVRRVQPDQEAEYLLVGQKGDGFRKAFPEIPALIDHGDFLLVRAAGHRRQVLRGQVRGEYSVIPVQGDREVYHYFSSPQPASHSKLQWIEDLVASIEEAPLKNIFKVLIKGNTRYTFSKGYAATLADCEALLEGWGYVVSRQQKLVGIAPVESLIADKAGKLANDRRVLLVVAHLDSINKKSAKGKAPGYDDNASGCAGLLHISQVLQSHSAEQDLRLILFGGEEQNLIGSNHYVDQLSSSERSRILGIINMDMIGRSTAASPGVHLCGNVALSDHISSSAATYTPALSISLGPSVFSSDHEPFSKAGIPAVLTTERGNNPDRHKSTDKKVDFKLMTEITRMNLAAIARSIGKSP